MLIFIIAKWGRTTNNSKCFIIELQSMFVKDTHIIRNSEYYNQTLYVFSNNVRILDLMDFILFK